MHVLLSQRSHIVNKKDRLWYRLADELRHECRDHFVILVKRQGMERRHLALLMDVHLLEWTEGRVWGDGIISRIVT